MARDPFPIMIGIRSAPPSFRWANAPARVTERPTEHGEAPTVPDERADQPGAAGPGEPDARPSHEVALLRRLASGRGSLPVLPRVATVAMKLASDPDAPFDELDGLLRGDPPLAARLISVANSVAYRRGPSITNTRAAIGRLGLVRTRDLLFQTVYAASSMGVQRHQREVQASVARSVRCAAVAELLVTRLAIPAEGAYLTGLLHDIGETRVYRLLESVDLPSRDDAAPLVARYHERAGRELAIAWQLPDGIAAACGAHHDVTLPGPHERLAHATDVVVDHLGSHDVTDMAAALGVGVDEAEDIQRAAIEAVRVAGR